MRGRAREGSARDQVGGDAEELRGWWSDALAADPPSQLQTGVFYAGRWSLLAALCCQQRNEHVRLSPPASSSDAKFLSDLFSFFLNGAFLKQRRQKPFSVDCHVNGFLGLCLIKQAELQVTEQFSHSFLLGFDGVQIMSESRSMSDKSLKRFKDQRSWTLNAHSRSLMGSFEQTQYAWGKQPLKG